MGTAKRERQKANRQQKLQEIAKVQRRRKGTRLGLKIGIALLVVAGIVAFVSLRGDDDDTPPTDTVPAGSTLPADQTSTTVDTSTTTVGSTATDSTAVASTTLPELPPETAPWESISGETPCPEADGSSPRTVQFANPPINCLEDGVSYSAIVTTNKGAYTIELDAEAAPIAVNNFVVLARYHYFDNTICHRAIPAFAVQCGDPTGTGQGGPGYNLTDELPEGGTYQVGSIAMANGGPNTSGSQFFVITGDDGAALQPDYTLFGQVTDGLDTTVAALDALANPDQAANGVPPLGLIVIVSVEIVES